MTEPIRKADGSPLTVDDLPGGVNNPHPVPAPEVVAEHKYSTENGDVLECGIIEINDDRQPVAYAQLGATTVSITRGRDGRVRIEIDDIADEPVYVSANTQTLLSAGHLGYGNVEYMPWTGDEMKEANDD